MPIALVLSLAVVSGLSRLVDGQQAGEIPLDEAAAIADTLGLPVPPSATD